MSLQEPLTCSWIIDPHGSCRVQAVIVMSDGTLARPVCTVHEKAGLRVGWSHRVRTLGVLTPHQRGVLVNIIRQTQHRDWAYSTNVGCRSACQHLRAKAWIIEEAVSGPRGGTTYRYRLTPQARLSNRLPQLSA